MRRTSEYKAYLRSDRWKERREKRIRKAKGACDRCDRVHPKGLQCHHKWYVNLFKETDSDLIVLCYKCHKIADRRRRRVLKWFYTKRFYIWVIERPVSTMYGSFEKKIELWRRDTRIKFPPFVKHYLKHGF